MQAKSLTIREVEGGFIVDVQNNISNLASEALVGGARAYTERVFSDSASLLNFLHNELVGSN